jgi:hypothetical protein
MDSPALAWTLTATSTRILALLNTMSAAMPLATWRLRSLVRARQRLASTLGMGPVAADRDNAQRPHRNAHARADVFH